MNDHKPNQDINEIKRIYSNSGNLPLVKLLDDNSASILDVGCGAGDNAALIKAYHPNCKIFGITHSLLEARLALAHLEHCWVFDIEKIVPDDLAAKCFDVMIFSHVLEHLRDPATVFAVFTQMLVNGGTVLIAVPNVLFWRQRVKFIIGQFDYESTGTMDETHLRFFTYWTADRFLLGKGSNLYVEYKGASGSVPLWFLRRYLFPKSLSERIDKWGCKHWPNLFGGQILIKAVKK
ncbi:class I SAM-dependent methyltransferase [Desulfohalobiaceae bacterium Ax17]|uniref:class I SAM-dependent methyltransferase n=1 Tax=Desulfovulcanus ferrireducens TaxID=2831190 RepID=UPI00207BC9CF|nr:class I SAM-dependent methyltransferase [Desulfovulcanus ferrireducens]